MGCSQVSVYWVIQHPEGSTVEAHHVRHFAIIILYGGGGNWRGEVRAVNRTMTMAIESHSVIVFLQKVTQGYKGSQRENQWQSLTSTT